MKQDENKIVVVGGGIAGLCAAVYAQRCGYQAEVLEMHDIAGGLATSWRRGRYTFETCLHWLYGSNPNSPMHSQWLEVCDIDKLTFVNQEEFGRVEREDGDSLGIYTNVDRLETELLKRAPREASAIRGFASAIRRFGKFKMPDPSAGWAANLSTLLRNVPCLPLLRELMRMSCREYGERFTDPLLKSTFGDGEMGQLSAIALFFSLAWMNQHDAAYAVGGAQALIRLIEEKLASLGGRVRFGAKVERILVENDVAVGVQLAGGETIAADWVISAADGHATIYDLLGGKYMDKATKKTYEEMQTFPSYLQVSLGVALDLAGQPVSVTRLLDSPLQVDPGTKLNQASFRIFNFDPTFAPAGKTAVTCFLPTRNFAYWVQLQQHDPAAYGAEKHRIAEAVIAILERKIPELRQAIEVIDVSTPATVIRYTGNWKGSMEGWFIRPGGSFRPLPNMLPGLRRFMMVGQWVMPGGGLPSGPMTARPAIRAICKQDGVPFTPQRKEPLPSRDLMKMRVLIAYASRYGATQGIAERIAAVLRREGVETVVQPAQIADDPAGYDAVVIGSAAYFFHWMKHSVTFVRSHRDVLANRPVWLFSSGPLGSEPNDAQGRDLREVTLPKEIAEFRHTIEPKDHRVFFGAMNPEKLSFTHRLVFKLPVNRNNAIFPTGDFREWNEIEGWATAIAHDLKASADSSTLCHAETIPG